MASKTAGRTVQSSGEHGKHKGAMTTQKIFEPKEKMSEKDNDYSNTESPKRVCQGFNALKPQ